MTFDPKTMYMQKRLLDGQPLNKKPWCQKTEIDYLTTITMIGYVVAMYYKNQNIWDSVDVAASDIQELLPHAESLCCYGYDQLQKSKEHLIAELNAIAHKEDMLNHMNNALFETTFLTGAYTLLAEQKLSAKLAVKEGGSDE